MDRQPPKPSDRPFQHSVAGPDSYSTGPAGQQMPRLHPPPCPLASRPPQRGTQHPGTRPKKAQNAHRQRIIIRLAQLGQTSTPSSPSPSPSSSPIHIPHRRQFQLRPFLRHPAKGAAVLAAKTLSAARPPPRRASSGPPCVDSNRSCFAHQLTRPRPPVSILILILGPRTSVVALVVTTGRNLYIGSACWRSSSARRRSPEHSRQQSANTNTTRYMTVIRKGSSVA